MAASLSYRSSGANVSTSNQWQDVSVPRRPRPEKSDIFLANESSTNNDNLPSSSALPRKRPRSSSEGRREVGEAVSLAASSSSKGDYYHSTTTTSSSSSLTKPKTIHKSSGQEERRSSLGSLSSSGGDSKRLSSGDIKGEKRASVNSVGSLSHPSENNKAARRSSMESVKSTTSTNSSGSGGFRRLKKFGKKKGAAPPSPEAKPKAKPKPKPQSRKSSSSIPFKPPTTAEDVSAAETFQQTQLRLWKAAQEQHKKQREEQERKRLKQQKKQQLREKLQQERLSKKGGNDEEDSTRREAASLELSDRGSKDLDSSRSSSNNSSNKPTKKEQQRRENISGSSYGSDDDEDPATSDEEREARKLKKKNKLKKLKQKKKMYQDAEEEEPTTTTTLGKGSSSRPPIPVGSKVSVYWSEDEQYYDAVVVKERQNKKLPWKLEYTDGDIEWIDLYQHTFRFTDRKGKGKKSKKKKLQRENSDDSLRSEELDSSYNSHSSRERATDGAYDEDKEARKAKKLKKLKRDSITWSRNNKEEPKSISGEDREALKAKKKLKKLKKLGQERSAEDTSESSERSIELPVGEATREEELKKGKKLKKFRRASEASESTTEQPTSTHSAANDRLSSSQSSLDSMEAASSEVVKKKKKKRRLMELGEDKEMPRKKKKKIREEESSQRNNKDGKVDVEMGIATPTTPDRKTAAASSFDNAPLTPLSLGLADTVKTRVRSPAKAKDQLELLQAASFEKKKRKKNKSSLKESDGNADEKQTLKKKKKKKKKQLLFVDSHVPERSERTEGTDELLYDADVEATSYERARQKGIEKSSETMSDIAPSETSSSATVITGKVKKKKDKNRIHKLGSADIWRPSESDVETPPETEVRRSEQPLPLKKRMAMAAAAAAASESNLWERNAASSTTASKVSISSASGTGPGVTPEFGTEASSISEFTHPLGSMALPPPPAPTSTFHKPSSVPREIVSRPPSPPTRAPFGFGVGANASVLGPPVSGSESDSDSSCDSDTDEEELFSWANKMFGTSAAPVVTEESKCKKAELPSVETTNLTEEMCEMERRRQKQEEARTLSIKEANAILQEEQSSMEPAGGHWVRRSVRQPSRYKLHDPLVRKLLDKLRGNDKEMVVLKMKKYLSDPDTPSMLIDAALEALEENSNCEALYIQNFNVGMKDKQVLHLLRILQMPSCNIWCLNIGETYNVTEDTWEQFAEGLKRTKVTHMYASEHTITAELKEEIRDTIRWNRKKHSMHNDPENLDVIIQCTHCWWNPINAKVLRPYLRKRGFESLLNDKEAQGLRGSISEAPGS